MKKKLLIITGGILIIALLACAGVFLSQNPSKIEAVFSDTLEALDTEKGLNKLFLEEAYENSETLDEDIKAANEFYQGKSTEINDLTIYRTAATTFVAYAFVKTDEGKEYMVCATINGSRAVDPCGLKLLIIDDKTKHLNKKLFGFEKSQEFFRKTREYGISIKTEIPEAE